MFKSQKSFIPTDKSPETYMQGDTSSHEIIARRQFNQCCQENLGVTGLTDLRDRPGKLEVYLLCAICGKEYYMIYNHQQTITAGKNQVIIENLGD